MYPQLQPDYDAGRIIVTDGGFPKIRGALLRVFMTRIIVYDMDHNRLGSILWSPYFRKLPFRAFVEKPALSVPRVATAILLAVVCRYCC